MVESTKNCPACKAVLRPNAVFCHHCGRSLSIAESNSHVPDTQNLSAERLPLEKETVLGEEPTTVIKTTAAPITMLEKPEAVNGAAIITDLTAAKIADSQSGRTAHTSVAPLAQRVKRYVSRTEYIWEESSAPSVRIILFSFLALLLVTLLLWLNNFLR